MSRIIPRRLQAQSPFSTTSDLLPSCRLLSRCLRPFSQTSRRADEERAGGQSIPNPSAAAAASTRSWFQPPSRSASSRPQGQSGSAAPMRDLSSSFSRLINEQREGRLSRPSISDIYEPLVPTAQEKFEEPHHFHVYSTRHNCHITFTRPDRTPIISVSCGNIGFKNSARKTYDAAFQLAAYAMGKITDHKEFVEIKKLEVTLRGFGNGREAVTKALLGTEGRFLRGKVVRVQDATRLKFGGTRSKKPRRLG